MRYIKSQDKDVNLEAGGEIEVCITPGFEITVLKKFAIIDCAVDIGVGAAVTGKAHLLMQRDMNCILEMPRLQRKKRMNSKMRQNTRQQRKSRHLRMNTGRHGRIKTTLPICSYCEGPASICAYIPLLK